MPENAWYRLGPALNKLPAGKEPKHAQPLGSPEGEPFGIYISDDTADFIGKYLLANPEHEMGGLLVGYVMYSHRPFIVISGAIEARYAQSVAGGISFTAKSFDYMQRVWEREYPDTLVLGWFCSHAGTGVQMSGYDQLVQRRWFNQPWQVAFIVDSVRNASLFHRWRDGELVPVEHFSVWSNHADPIHTLSQHAVIPPVKQELPQPKTELLVPLTELDAAEEEVAALEDYDSGSVRRVPFSYWLLLLVILFAFLWPALPWSLPRLWSTFREREVQLKQLEESLGAEDRTGGFGGMPQQPATTPQPSATATRSAGDEHLPAAPAVAPESDTSSHTGPVVADRQGGIYVIETGDTLWHISERTLGDPLQYQSLAEANQIPDPSLIHPGTTIKLVTPQP